MTKLHGLGEEQITMTEFFMAMIPPTATAQEHKVAVRNGKHKDGEYKISKPDTDNLQKMFKDCMTKLDFWTDDQLVASEICEKFWADIPGIYVRIEEL